MSDDLRRRYNRVDRLFDWRAIREPVHMTHRAGDTRTPLTALQALKFTRPFATQLDRQARLKLIVAQAGLLSSGASPHWEFFFDLPTRRAKLVCEWFLAWNEASDGYDPAQVTVTVNPFPPPDSPVHQMVQEGKLLHQQLVGMWRQERRRTPDLPTRLYDSDHAMADFIRQGLDPAQEEFSLSTSRSPQGQMSWVAHTRAKSYFSPLD